MEIFLYEQEFYSLENATSIDEMMITLPTSTLTRTTSTTTSTTTTTTSTFMDEFKTEAWQHQFDDMFNATVICKLID